MEPAEEVPSLLLYVATVVLEVPVMVMRVVTPLWGRLWREHEYRADLYAARLGEGLQLADFLATHAPIDDHPIPFVWLSGHSHPPTELRIDRLRRAGV